jgi:hypothetical protein
MHSRAGHHALVWVGQHALRGGNHAWGLGGGGSLVPLPRISFSVKLKILKHSLVPVSPGRVPGVAAANFAVLSVSFCSTEQGPRLYRL